MRIVARSVTHAPVRLFGQWSAVIWSAVRRTDHVEARDQLAIRSQSHHHSFNRQKWQNASAEVHTIHEEYIFRAVKCGLYINISQLGWIIQRSERLTNWSLLPSGQYIRPPCGSRDQLVSRSLRWIIQSSCEILIYTPHREARRQRRQPTKRNLASQPAVDWIKFADRSLRIYTWAAAITDNRIALYTTKPQNKKRSLLLSSPCIASASLIFPACLERSQSYKSTKIPHENKKEQQRVAVGHGNAHCM